MLSWGCGQYLDIFSRTARPFELGDVSFCRKQFRLQIHPVEITRKWDKRYAMDQKSSKTWMMISAKMTVFWTFPSYSTWAYSSFLTRHRSHWDTSFGIKLSEAKNSGSSLASDTHGSTLPSDHWSHLLKSYRFFRNRKNWPRIRVQLAKLRIKSHFKTILRLYLA